jgi:hypothetical protein
LSFTDERESRRRRKPEPDNPSDEGPPRARKKRSATGDVGNALRSAYDRVVDEDIPPEMLDLLGKLG